MISELLIETGALSVTVEDAAKGTDRESPIFDEFLPSASSWQDDVKKYWGESLVTGYFEEEWDVDSTMSMLSKFSGAPLDYTITRVAADRDWVMDVQKGWDPITIGSLELRFPWHMTEEEEQQQQQLASSPKHLLVLSGGNAFGTGEHPTTRMCCSWLEELISQELHQHTPQKRVCDFGSGSGILGMASLRFGASEAVGVEIDVAAIYSALENVRVNGLEKQMRFYQPSKNGRFTKVLDEEGDVTEEEELAPFDVCVANILGPTLINLRPVIANFVVPGGALALSGILWDQAEKVADEYRHSFPDIAISRTDGDWVLLTGIKGAAASDS
jgi:ribosomal protein L11 methyltransferase